MFLTNNFMGTPASEANIRTSRTKITCLLWNVKFHYHQEAKLNQYAPPQTPETIFKARFKLIHASLR